MGPLILVTLVGAMVVLIGFALYGVLLGMQALGRTFMRLFWPDLTKAERPVRSLEGYVVTARPTDEGKRCWDMRRCLLSKREQCPAFEHPSLPCWLANMRSHEGYTLKPDCVACSEFSLPALLN